MLYTSSWSRLARTTSVVICTDCIGSCESNYLYDHGHSGPLLQCYFYMNPRTSYYLCTSSYSICVLSLNCKFCVNLLFMQCVSTKLLCSVEERLLVLWMISGRWKMKYHCWSYLRLQIQISKSIRITKSYPILVLILSYVGGTKVQTKRLNVIFSYDSTFEY